MVIFEKKVTTILSAITYITFFSEITPFAFCICFRNKINTKSLRLFFIYAILLSLFSFFGALFHYLDQKSMYYWAVRFYTISEYILFSLFFIEIIENKSIGTILKLSIFPFVFFSLINGLVSGEHFKIYPLLIEFIVFILVIIFFLFERMKSESDILLYQSIYFWICVGLFFYFSGNFFYMLLVEYSVEMSPEAKSQLKIIYSAVTISKNIILGLSLLTPANPPKNDDNYLLPQDLNLDTITTNSSIH